MKRFDQKGSHVIGLLLFVAFIAVVGFTGYKVWQMHNSASNTPSSSTTASVTPPAKIQNTSDLKQAASALDAAATQLNSGLNDSSLNTDMQSML